ncbi:MAG TPA: phosphoribosylaminoimidazolesuccinocarboxamide synthase, partial [Pirellulales bacterium]
LARKAEVVQVECVVRGYLAGSGWKDYQRHGAVCGVPLRAGLQNADRLPEPIFTPATKAETGHDENISFAEMVARIGAEAAETLKTRSLEVYRTGAEWAEKRGVVIADTKFEWGRINGEWILVDEVLTPDSSRFWSSDDYRPGANPPSFDKQFVRDWLESSGWDKESPPPELPPEIVNKTRDKYIAAYELLTGERFPWA